MGSPERRERERQETRRKILDASRKMFVRRGYEATTMRAIAKEVEYTPTAIYHHFRNKEALLNELSTIDFQALAQTFQRVGRVEDPLERLAKIGTAYVEFAQKHPMQYQLMFMTTRLEGAASEPPPGDPSERAYGILRETCAEAIKTGKLRPELDDPDALAQMSWALVHGLVSLRIVKGRDDWIAWRDLRTTAEVACDSLIRGLRKPARR